ncbi:MAG TPA: DUF819 family protein [Chitinophagaceae bacterium]|nr:DUF819 family protein [Chitinophagaceae bacterium]
MPAEPALITDDVVVLGIIGLLFALIFSTASSQRPVFRTFYKYVPAILLCYFLPGLLNTAGIISGKDSKLYPVISSYLLPASLVLFTLSLDLREIWKLRKKAGVMFLASVFGVLIGGPLAVLLVGVFAPEVVGGEGPQAVWRGLATIAGTWIGGGANQAALYEVFKPSPELFAACVAVDVIVANIWMALLLLGASAAPRIDRYFKADTSELSSLKEKMEQYRLAGLRIPSTSEIMIIVGIAAGVTGIARWAGTSLASWIAATAPQLEKFSLTSSFLWTVLIATAIGIALSFTKARKLEGAGASRIGTMFLYFLIATIGMQMNVMAIFSQPGLFIVGFIWITIHGLVLLVIGKLTKAPFFFLAVNSQACIGGAASAPVVASAFHTSLAPVGVLLGICGYAVGTYGGYVCGLLMQWASS